jgi:NDP-sugar pyrophosphorylase family protein
LLPELPQDPVLVVNGDLVTQADIGALFEFHRLGGYHATMAVRQYVHTVPFGCVDVERDQVTLIEEKPMLSRLVNAGIYLLNREVIARVPPDTAYPITTLLEQTIASGGRVGAWQVLDDWLDVGHHDQLRIARSGVG